MRGKEDATTFILLCFNVLSTLPRENRLGDFLYLYIYIFIYKYMIFFFFPIGAKNKNLGMPK